MPLVSGITGGLRSGLKPGLNGLFSSGAPVRATITWAEILKGSSTTNATSYVTASVSPTSNKPVYLGIYSAQTTGQAVAPTVTGAGLTWTEVDTSQFGTSRLTVFEAYGAVTPGALTIDFGGIGQSGVTYVIVQATGADADATVQEVDTQSGVASTTLTNTLAALENANNHHLAFVGINAAAAVTADADFTPLSADTEISPAMAIDASYAANQTACSPTWASTTVALMVSLEVKSGVA